MDEKKQIEEMAKVILRANDNYDTCNKDDCEVIASLVYNAGYHKQREGEWKEVYRNNKATVYECSCCKHLTFGTSDYCICGAKMKGGAE